MAPLEKIYFSYLVYKIDDINRHFLPIIALVIINPSINLIEVRKPSLPLCSKRVVKLELRCENHRFPSFRYHRGDIVYKDVQGMKIGKICLSCRILSHLYRGSVYYEVLHRC